MNRRRFSFLVGFLLPMLSAEFVYAGTYLARASLLLRTGWAEIKTLSQRLHDRELAVMVHAMAEKRLEVARGMLVPKEVEKAHPHLLLVLELLERAADAAQVGKAESFLSSKARAGDELSTLRAVLKGLGYELEEPREKS